MPSKTVSDHKCWAPFKLTFGRSADTLAICKIEGRLFARALDQSCPLLCNFSMCWQNLALCAGFQHASNSAPHPFARWIFDAPQIRRSKNRCLSSIQSRSTTMAALNCPRDWSICKCPCFLCKHCLSNWYFVCASATFLAHHTPCGLLNGNPLTDWQTACGFPNKICILRCNCTVCSCLSLRETPYKLYLSDTPSSTQYITNKTDYLPVLYSKKGPV